MEFTKTKNPLRGEIIIPGDKSISHRAVMFGAISEGTTEITNFLQGQDCLSTISCFRKMGIEIEKIKSWFTGADCTDCRRRPIFWMQATAAQRQD